MYCKGIHVKNFFVSIVSTFSIFLAVACFFMKLPGYILSNSDRMKLMIVGTSFEYTGSDYKDPQIPEKHIPVQPSSTSVILDDETPDTPVPGKKTYNIIETKLGECGEKYENFYVKKDTPVELNIENELKTRPDIHIKTDGSPQVLIYHTHTTEAYMDKNNGFYYEDWASRTTDNNKNVTQVGDQIAAQLKNAGIGVIHDTTVHDNPSYNGSYKRSADTMQKNLSQYPSIQVTIDIHRDALGSNESGKIKPTFLFNKRKGAQIMIIAGSDPDGTFEFPDWEYNLRFALKLQSTVETLFPGMTRPMYFTDARYNMNKTHGSLLIEVGSDANSINEAKYSGELLGKALVDVLKKLKD